MDETSAPHPQKAGVLLDCEHAARPGRPFQHRRGIEWHQRSEVDDRNVDSLGRQPFGGGGGHRDHGCKSKHGGVAPFPDDPRRPERVDYLPVWYSPLLGNSALCSKTSPDPDPE